MNDIERQILENQMSIMSVLRRYSDDKDNMGHVGSLSSRMGKTDNLLNPKQEPSLSERTHDALLGQGEQ